MTDSTVEQWASWIKKLRRKVAGFILGEQLALFVPKGQMHVLKEGAYADLPDDTLAAATRYWFVVISKSSAKIASERNIPVTVFSTSHSVMSIIRYAIDVNAEQVEITQSGDIAGRSIGVWTVTAEKQPDDYDFGPKGVQEEWSDDGRLTRLTLGYNFPSTKDAQP